MCREQFCRLTWVQKIAVLLTLLTFWMVFWCATYVAFVKPLRSTVVSGRNIAPLVMNITRTVVPDPNLRLAHLQPHRGIDVAPCQPSQRFVFMKIHKTGSSTIATILLRYGYRRDLNFALPNEKSHIFQTKTKYHFDTPELVFQWNLKDKNGVRVWPALGGYQALVNHALYNRTLDEILIPNAKYFTMIREPVARIVSHFHYFRLDQGVPHNLSEEPLEVFMRNPQKYVKNNLNYKFFRNGQFLLLGLEPEYFENPQVIEAAIDSLSRGVDLVMLNEYFDESLLLLKKLMCWGFQDIIYISKQVRKLSKNHTSIPAGLRDKILRWNAADLRLYEHFNRTFWTKVQEYGPEFGRDLDTFRSLKGSMAHACYATGSRVSAKRGVETWKLSAKASEKCQDLAREDFD